MFFDRLQFPIAQSFSKEKHEQRAGDQTKRIDHDDSLRAKHLSGVANKERGQWLQAKSQHGEKADNAGAHVTRRH